MRKGADDPKNSRRQRHASGDENKNTVVIARNHSGRAGLCRIVVLDNIITDLSNHTDLLRPGTLAGRGGSGDGEGLAISW